MQQLTTAKGPKDIEELRQEIRRNFIMGCSTDDLIEKLHARGYLL
jgi:hypothetical protein